MVVHELLAVGSLRLVVLPVLLHCSHCHTALDSVALRSLRHQELEITHKNLCHLNRHVNAQRHGGRHPARDIMGVHRQRPKERATRCSSVPAQHASKNSRPSLKTLATLVFFVVKHSDPLHSRNACFALPIADLTTSIDQISPRPVKLGGLSDVYTGMLHTRRGRVKVALKVLRVIGPPDENISKMFLREISIWQTLEHPNVQHLLGLCGGISERVPAMVSEWFQHGDINQYLRPRRHDPSSGFRPLVYQLLTQVWSGLHYLHEKNIVHADIKGANVLISDDHVARLADFGLSKLLEPDGSETVESISEYSTCSGTCRWMAPEIVTVDDPSPHSKASDIWACGCLVIEVLSGQVPYHTKPTTTSVILALAGKERPPRPEGIDDSYWRFAQGCCAVLPEERPSIEEVQRRMRYCQGEI